MTKNPISHALVITFLVLLVVGCGKKASDEIDFGAVSNAVYQNKYFGLHMPLPPDWSVQDAAMRKRLTEAGQKMVVGDNANVKAILKASEQQSVSLLAAFRHPPGKPVPFNPNIIGAAERLRDFPGIERGKDYHFHTKRIMESGQLKMEFPKEISTEKLGGIDFDVMHVSLKVGNVVVRQAHYATIMKGYALLFVVSFTTAEEEAALQNILKGMSFKT